jgi:Fe2+ or Zn2+ uptake regulation protein
MTEFQKAICEELSKDIAIGGFTLDTIAARLRSKFPKVNRLAVNSSCRSLQKQGLVNKIPAKDQWSCERWCIARGKNQESVYKP